MMFLEGSIIDNFFEYNPDYLKVELGIFIAIVVISFFRFIFGKVGLFEDLIYSLGSWIIAMAIGLNLGAYYYTTRGVMPGIVIPTACGGLLILYTIILEVSLLILAIKEGLKIKNIKETKLVISESYLWGLLLGCARWGFIF